MNGVSRFLSRRDRKSKVLGDKSQYDRPQHHPHVPKDLYRIFHPEETKKIKNEEQKVRDIIERLKASGITDLQEEQCEYALKSRSTDGDVDKAVELLQLFEDALHGNIKDYSLDTKLLGAENRELISCYLDSLLFAMFARQDSFEALLEKDYEDAERKKLVTILRLWVNMLRSGKLITTDITRHLQDALGICGWEDATKIRQQDVSEAFTFITDKLELPLLTLKMDVYHTGKADTDDHKIVRERLLDVALPEPNQDGTVIRLEDCLETYFNNRIEVRRHLQRRNTLQSLRASSEKHQMMLSERAEFGPESPSLNPPPPFSPGSWPARGRTESLFNNRRLSVDDTSALKARDDSALPTKRPRAGTFRKEVLMPAWQFFSLIPWATTEAPANDVQVVQHLTQKRPVLGICLKRYSMTAQGVSTRMDTYIDIPTEIGLPHFISENSSDGVSNFSNFKLSLQSVICHRGKSLDSGHYVSLVRGYAANASDDTQHQANGMSRASSNTNQAPANFTEGQAAPTNLTPTTSEGASSTQSSDRQPTGPWMLFDDLAKERVTYVDIQQALKDECPYLLFYQVQPIDETVAYGAPPSYESVVQSLSQAGSTRASFEDTRRTEERRETASDSSSAHEVSATVSVRSSGSAVNTAASLPAGQNSPFSEPQITLSPVLTREVEPSLPAEPLMKLASSNTAPVYRDHRSGLSTPRLSVELPRQRPKSIDLPSASRQQIIPSLPTAPSGQSQMSDNFPESRTSMSSVRRTSVVFTDTSTAGSIKGPGESVDSGNSSVPITPSEELDNELGAATTRDGNGGGSLRNAFRGMGRRRRNSSVGGGPKTSSPNLSSGTDQTFQPRTKPVRSRPVSQSGENRISMNLGGLNLSNLGIGKLRAAASKDKLADVSVIALPIDENDKEDKKKGGVRRGKSLRVSRKDKDATPREKGRATSINRLSGFLGQGAPGHASAGPHEAVSAGNRPDRECVVM